MHFVHFANVIGCNNMLMLKYCKSLQKFLKTFASFWSIYFILFYMCERHKAHPCMEKYDVTYKSSELVH